MRYCTRKSARSSKERADIGEEIDDFVKRVLTDMVYKGGTEYTIKVHDDVVYAIFQSRQLASHLRKTFPAQFTNQQFKVVKSEKTLG